MSSFADTDLPVIAAPMAGGPSTPALVNAVADAGGFAFLAGGYKTPEVLRSEIKAVRGSVAFGVNLFVPQRDASGALLAVDPDVYAAYAAALAEDADALGLTLPREPKTDDDAWHDKLDVLLADPVAVVSLTFGLPDLSDITALQRTGSQVLASVTTVGEAREAAAAGVDGLVVQGPRAGGHSATFDPVRQLGSEPTLDVLRAVRGTTSLPLIAAGGVDGPQMVAELIRAGAQGVAVGTLLLAADEAGTSPVHRAALSDDRFTETVVTTAFTGRPARALRNDFIDRYAAIAPSGYPAIHHLTRQLRQVATKNGNPHLVHLWAGTGYRDIVPGPAASIIERLVSDL